MRKLIFIIAALTFLASSCSDGPTYSQQYVIVSTFEYTDTDYEKVFGSDSTYFDATNGIGLSWGDLAFYHKVEIGGFFQGGFMLSYMKSAGFGEKPEGYTPSPYRVAGNYSSKTNRTYAVFCQEASPMMPTHDVVFLSSKYGTCTPRHCWVNNSEAVYEALKENGGSLTLKATGYLGDDVTGTAEIKLAADTVMYNWTRFNLAPLGVVDAVDFELQTTAQIPMRFCMDEFTADIKIEY